MYLALGTESNGQLTRASSSVQEQSVLADLAVSLQRLDDVRLQQAHATARQALMHRQASSHHSSQPYLKAVEARMHCAWQYRGQGSQGITAEEGCELQEGVRPLPSSTGSLHPGGKSLLLLFIIE